MTTLFIYKSCLQSQLKHFLIGLSEVNYRSKRKGNKCFLYCKLYAVAQCSYIQRLVTAILQYQCAAAVSQYCPIAFLLINRQCQSVTLECLDITQITWDLQGTQLYLKIHTDQTIHVGYTIVWIVVIVAYRCWQYWQKYWKKVLPVTRWIVTLLHWHSFLVPPIVIDWEFLLSSDSSVDYVRMDMDPMTFPNIGL